MEFKEAIKKIKHEYDIVDYVRNHGIDLKETGNGRWVGLCPFHNEKTPSFTINEGFQGYHCFGCGEKGDLINFVAHTHTLSLGESIKMLADEKGIEIGVFNKEQMYDVNKIREVVRDASLFYRENFESLLDSHPAKKEVLKRGLSLNNEIYGYSLEAPNELYKYLVKKGHKDKDIMDSKLVVFFEDGRSPWDFFHGRLMITINDYLGRPVSFTSRKIFEDDKMPGKYVNGKDSPIYSKKNILFGADKAKKSARAQKTLYVTEGNFDEIILRENGIENVVAASGTAFTEEHANLLLRMVGKSGTVVFIMDGDIAGSDSMVKIFNNHPILHNQSYALHLDSGMDPCDYVMKNGIEKLKQKIDEKSTPLHHFIFNHALNAIGGDITERNRREFIGKISESINFTKNNIKDDMLNKLSMYTAISIDNIKKMAEEYKVGSFSKKKGDRDLGVPAINLDNLSTPDKTMLAALAILIRIPEDTLESTPDTVATKFKEFIGEVRREYDRLISEGKSWVFIKEDYSNLALATYLQDLEMLEDPKEDRKNYKEQYIFLFGRANEVYKLNYNRQRKSRSLSAYSGKVLSPKEVYNILIDYDNSNRSNTLSV